MGKPRDLPLLKAPLLILVSFGLLAALWWKPRFSDYYRKLSGDISGTVNQYPEFKSINVHLGKNPRRPITVYGAVATTNDLLRLRNIVEQQIDQSLIDFNVTIGAVTNQGEAIGFHSNSVPTRE